MIQPLAQVFVQPGNIDMNGTRAYAARTPGAQLGKARVLELPRPRLPGSAHAAGISFSAKGMSAHHLKICAGVQARTAPDAIQRLPQHGVFAHAKTAVVNQDEMKLARLSRLPGHREGRVIQRRTQKTGIGSQLLTRAAGREEL